jgi:hypothetical protein
MSQLFFSGSRNIHPLRTFPNNNRIYQSWNYNILKLSGMGVFQEGNQFKYFI